MRKVLISIAAASAALVAAAPASAQSWGAYAQRHYGYPGDRGLINRFENQIRQQEQRIERLAQRRAISPGEYRSLRQQAQNVRQRMYRFARNGLSRGEVRDIDARIDNLNRRIRDERRDGRRRW